MRLLLGGSDTVRQLESPHASQNSVPHQTPRSSYDNSRQAASFFGVEPLISPENTAKAEDTRKQDTGSFPVPKHWQKPFQILRDCRHQFCVGKYGFCLPYTRLEAYLRLSNQTLNARDFAYLQQLEYACSHWTQCQNDPANSSV